MQTKHKKQRGGTSIIAVFFVALFAVLALSFTAMSNVNVQMSRNHHHMAAAQSAAESGLQYASYIIDCYIVEDAIRTTNNTVSDTEAQQTFDDLLAYFQSTLNDRPALGSESIGSAVSILGGRKFVIPPIKISPSETTTFSIEVIQYDADPHTIVITSSGVQDDVSRKVGLNYSIEKDTRVLEYAVASRSRIIVTGDSTINQGIYTTWSHPGIADPIELETESTINGDINTTLGESDFPTDNITGDYEQINYDQPDVVEDLGISGFEADDYDTSMYLAGCDALSPADASGQVTEYFPHAPDDYTQPANGNSRKTIRKIYEGTTFANVQVSAGSDALFRNCVFNEILYVGSGGGGNATNNVRFENCTFNGSIVTSIPNTFGLEDWKKNVLYFTGEAIFNNTYMEEATILAPNYNVNIGNTKAAEEGCESVLTGLVVGGVVDVRGNARVDGTIISMAYPDPYGSWGSSAGYVATNIGYSDENEEAGVPEDQGTITITPDPDRSLPIGIYSKILIEYDGNSYVEF